MTDKEYLSIQEFCKVVGISRTTFYQHLKNGIAPKTIKFGRRVLIPKVAYLEWQQQMESNMETLR